jgi:hypothetical protein
VTASVIPSDDGLVRIALCLFSEGISKTENSKVFGG